MASDGARWLSLERTPGETLRAALERTLREAILSRALRAGVRLPASRALAEQLGVSRGVVSDAYGQLEAQGFLIGRTREARVIASVQRPKLVRGEPTAQEPAPRYDLVPPDPTCRSSRWRGGSPQCSASLAGEAPRRSTTESLVVSARCERHWPIISAARAGSLPTRQRS